MMINRWKRVCAVLCMTVLLNGLAFATEETRATVPDTQDSQSQAEDITLDTQETQAEEEQVIDTGTLPDNIRLLLETAIGEIGYTEESDGYNKYGAWAGDAYSQWCAEFVCWCVNMTDHLYDYDMLNTVYPYYTGQNTGRDWFISRGRFVYRKGYQPGWGRQWLKNGTGLMETNEYIPRPGDLVYFSYNSDGDTVHVALVEYCAYAADGSVNIHVIEGNNPDKVQRTVYALDNSQVLGFGCWGDVVDTTMQYGNTGDKVLALQQNLGRLGYLAERNFTGTYASNTRNAVTAFQQNMSGKTPTGVADRDTQLAIAYQIEELDIEDLDSWLVTDGD